MDTYYLKKRAKILRKESTDAEHYLWYYLRAKRLGHKFKRQALIGKYIADFACYEKQLIIELDGGQHQEQANYDRLRTNWLNKEGFRVLRFWNNEVLREIDSVLEVIWRALEE